MSELIFNQSPIIEIATNKFINVPVILRYDDLNLIEVVKNLDLGYQTKIPIYHSDGTYLAVAINSRIFLTKEGEKAGIVIEKHPKLWVCKMDGKELFEIHQQDDGSFKTIAELFTNDGSFVKCSDLNASQAFDLKGNEIRFGGVIMRGNTFKGCPVGINIKSNGSIIIGGF